MSDKNTPLLLLPHQHHWRENAAFVAMALVIVTLPFFIQINSICIMLLAGVWLINGNWQQKLTRLRTKPLLFLPILLFVFMIFSYIISADKKTAGFELEKKLSLLAFPLIFSGITFTGPQRRLLLAMFVLSSFAASAYCMAHAFNNFPVLGRTAFFYHQLSSPLGFHAVYFSCYVAFCIILLFTELTQNFLAINKPKRWFYIAGILYFLVFLTLLSSKTILVATMALLIFILAKHFVNFRKNAKLFAATVMVFGMIIFLISRTEFVKERFREIAGENYSEIIKADDYRNIAFTGGTIRLAIWKSVVEILNSENAWLTGTGIGDAQNKLTQHYQEKNIYPGDEVLGFKGFLHYNAHNQYFEFLISTGIVGLLLFMIWLILLYREALKTRRTELLCFLMLMSLFFLTESALSAHKGIVLFVLIPLLFTAESEELSHV